MARLRNRLEGTNRVGIDTNCIIYLQEGAPDPLAQEEAEFLFGAIESGALTGIVSTITLQEVLVGPMRQGRRDLVNTYRAFLRSFPNLALMDVSDRVAELAAELRAKYLNQGKKLKTPDALCVATAILAGCSAFVTNDIHLAYVDEIRIVPL